MPTHRIVDEGGSGVLPHAVLDIMGEGSYYSGSTTHQVQVRIPLHWVLGLGPGHGSADRGCDTIKHPGSMVAAVGPYTGSWVC